MIYVLSFIAKDLRFALDFWTLCENPLKVFDREIFHQIKRRGKLKELVASGKGNYCLDDNDGGMSQWEGSGRSNG